jgi:Protein of unknown function (DUF2939)
MRKTIIASVLIVLAWLAYVAWPIVTLGTLARAVETGDVATAAHHIDVSAVRRSITDQIVDTYFKLTGKTASPLLRGAVTGAAGSIADPIVGRIIAPDALTQFLRDGWPSTVLPDRPPGISGLTAANLGNAWQVFAAAEYGIRRFEIELPPSLPRDRRIVLEFRLIQWRWQLADVTLPDQLRVRLAEALIKVLPKR